MADRTCARCGKQFRAPSYLQSHLKRKTSCAPILDVQDLPEHAQNDPDLEQKKCRFCGRVFSSRSSRTRHLRKACKIIPNARNGDAGIDLLYEHTLRKQQAQIDRLTDMMEKLTGEQGARGELVVQGERGITDNRVAVDNRIAADNLNQGIIATDNRKTVVNINVFGQENMDHLSAELVRKVLDEALRSSPVLELAAAAAVLKMSMMSYSDIERPDNLTCFLPNKKTTDALIHTAKGWQTSPSSLVIPPMVQSSINAIFDHQPFENPENYGALLRTLIDNEKQLMSGTELLSLLIRNKGLLMRLLDRLPVAGSE